MRVRPAGVSFLPGRGVDRRPANVYRYHGEGLPRDLAEAERLFGLAAAQGHARAQFNLATLREARGDDAGAIKLLRSASARGHRDAKRELRRIRASFIADGERLFGDGDDADLTRLGLR